MFPLQDFDGDGNGLMDREELCVGLRTLGADVPDEQCDWLFDQVRRRLSGLSPSPEMRDVFDCCAAAFDTVSFLSSAGDRLDLD